MKIDTFFDNIRSTESTLSLNQKIMHTVSILLFGIVLGTFSKFLDLIPANALPFMFESLDISNFLGRFAIWVLIALCISIYSHSPLRASLNVFVFFVGMVTSYYLYSHFIAGFFPTSYAMIWVGYTIISPVFAYICWYAKGKSKISLALSAMIIAVLFNMTFIYGDFYFDVISTLDLLTFVCAVVVLKRHTVTETAIMIVIGIGIAFVLDMIMPFYFY